MQNKSLSLFVNEFVIDIVYFSLFISEYMWSQEEHKNMGAWFFVAPRFENLVGQKVCMYWCMF